jgi:hypothetical protein
MTVSSHPPSGPSTLRPNRNTPGRKLAIVALVASATLVLVFGDFALWARRILLNTDDWVDTAGQVIDNDDVQLAVNDFAVDQIDELVNLDAISMTSLPGPAQQIGMAVGEASRIYLRNVVDDVLRSDQFRVIWIDANRTAHETFVAIVHDDSDVVAVQGDRVVVDLHGLLEEVKAETVAAGGTFLAGVEIPSDLGQFTAVTGDQVSTITSAINVLDRVAPLLFVVAIALYVAAVLVSRVKWKTLVVVGGSASAAALFVFVLLQIGRTLLGNAIDDSTPSAAAQAVWDIGTRGLRLQGLIIGVVGAGVLGVGLALGPFSWAENLRGRVGIGGDSGPAAAVAVTPDPTSVFGGAPPSAPPVAPAVPPSAPQAAPPSPPAAPPGSSPGPPPGPPPGRPDEPPASAPRPPPAYPPG